MTSLFSSWMGSNKLIATPEAEEVLNDAGPRAPRSPIDRSSSMTPKAPLQFNVQPLHASALPEHHREASDATLLGKFDTISSAQDYVYGDPSSSRPASLAGFGSELSHEHATTFSSTLGGVDSEAAWGDANISLTKGSARRKKRKIAPPELLVIVKPPPSKQVNPYNLQIQLVMPQNHSKRDGSVRRASLDSSVAPGEAPTRSSTELRRRGSIGSTRSAGSSGSIAASVASTGSGRRVTPLYNLNYHNILATTVTDAGTDQKVAKYVKKGIELDGFGTLEPAELINGVNDLATLSRGAPGRVGDSTLAPTSHREVHSNGSAENASAFSAPSNDGSAAPIESHAEPPTSFQAMTPEARGVEGNLGGKLLGRFKKLSLSVKPMLASGSVGDASSALYRLNTGAASITSSKHVTTQDIPQLAPGAGVYDGKKTEGYYWTVRRWNRRPQDGTPTLAQSRAVATAEGSNHVLNSVWKRFNLVNRLGGVEIHPNTKDINVRFEWSRNSPKLHRRRQAEEAHAKLRASASLNASRTSIDKAGTLETSKSRASLAQPSQQDTLPTAASAQSLGVDPELRKPASRRSSYVSGNGHRSPRRSFDTSAAGSSVPHSQDSNEDSDPEDSETPWACHLVLGPNTRIPLGSLLPAPHHPKLVGQLVVPFPLPDLSATGLGPDRAGLSREELKDVIIVTCLHLIVRESFGGLARRKSNGSVEPVKGANVNSGSVSGWRLANVPKK